MRNNENRNKMKKSLILITVLLMVMLFFGCSNGNVSSETAAGGKNNNNQSEVNYETIALETAEYIDNNIEQIAPGSIGGEWVLVGKTKSGAGVSDAEKDSYMELLNATLKEKDGVLDSRKLSEYSRTIVGLSAIEESADDVAGHNLFDPLENFNQVIFQGINGPIWAVIAADSQQYNLKTKQNYIDYILKNQLDDGGFALMGDQSDTDITAMAITGLSPYYSDYNKAIDKAVSAMADMQSENGEFISFDTETSESCSQVIIALCSLGIDPSKDERFVKGGKNPVETLLGYRNDDGGFSHLKGEESNQMASEQALLAFSALKCMENGEKIYQ